MQRKKQHPKHAITDPTRVSAMDFFRAIFTPHFQRPKGNTPRNNRMPNDGTGKRETARRRSRMKPERDITNHTRPLQSNGLPIEGEQQ